MKKILNREQAEKRYRGKLLEENYGHEVVIEWSGTPQTDNGKPDRFEIKCAKCRKTIWYYSSATNADGSIPISQVTQMNSHISSFVPEAPAEEAIKVMEVTMKRGGKHEFWAVHYQDGDFWDSIDVERWGSRHFPWMCVRKNTRSWRAVDSAATLQEAIGKIIYFQKSYIHKGYETEILFENATGHVPPTATIATSVKRLINEFKELRDNPTPIEAKEWLDKVNEALTQIGLLESLRDEAEETMHKSLLL